jgi:hypothetical protein
MGGAGLYSPADAIVDYPGIESRKIGIAGARRFAATGATPSRNLVIVHCTGWQAAEDWYEIAAHVCRIAPSVAVLVVGCEVIDHAAAKQAAMLPTLVFSPGPLGLFAPTRGKIYQSPRMNKVDQLRRLHAAGVPVPITAVLTPGLKLDARQWGEVVVVKPSHIETSSRGIGITAMRTEQVRYVAPEDYPPGHPGRFAPMLVQGFVDTGPRISLYRVLALFGRPLYCQLMQAKRPRGALTGPGAKPEKQVIATQAIKRMTETWVYSADAADLARRAYEALPEAPLQGCDVLREASTGRHFLLEVNPGGNTWHFSSNFLAAHRAENSPEFEAQRRSQLDAFGTTANLLAQRTLREAI